MTSTSQDFANVSLVDGITALGGVQPRTCTPVGAAGTLPCWYVDPSVGVIEGGDRLGAHRPARRRQPHLHTDLLAAPFYVLDRGTTEERHWLRADTGYGIDISGSRLIGKNERPRSTQSGSGVTWRSSSGLCDLTTGRYALNARAGGLTLTEAVVNGTFRPIALDAQGDGRAGDVPWYAPEPPPITSGPAAGPGRSLRRGTSAGPTRCPAARHRRRRRRRHPLVSPFDRDDLPVVGRRRRQLAGPAAGACPPACSRWSSTRTATGAMRCSGTGWFASRRAVGVDGRLLDEPGAARGRQLRPGGGRLRPQRQGRRLLVRPRAGRRPPLALDGCGLPPRRRRLRQRLVPAAGR